jgi:hypothetical protein
MTYLLYNKYNSFIKLLDEPFLNKAKNIKNIYFFALNIYQYFLLKYGY